MSLQEIRHGLAEQVPATWEDDGEEAVLVGYVIVAEWAGTEGKRWLTATAGDINDEEPAPWTVKGWLGHALDNAEGDEAEDE